MFIDTISRKFKQSKLLLKMDELPPNAENDPNNSYIVCLGGIHGSSHEELNSATRFVNALNSRVVYLDDLTPEEQIKLQTEKRMITSDGSFIVHDDPLLSPTFPTSLSSPTPLQSSPSPPPSYLLSLQPAQSSSPSSSQLPDSSTPPTIILSSGQTLASHIGIEKPPTVSLAHLFSSSFPDIHLTGEGLRALDHDLKESIFTPKYILDAKQNYKVGIVKSRKTVITKKNKEFDLRVMWELHTYYFLEDTFPSLSRRLRIVNRKELMFTPIMTSIMNVREQNNELRELIYRGCKQMDRNSTEFRTYTSNYTKTLQGTIMPGVNGGLRKIIKNYCDKEFLSENEFFLQQLEILFEEMLIQLELNKIGLSHLNTLLRGEFPMYSDLDQELKRLSDHVLSASDTSRYCP